MHWPCQWPAAADESFPVLSRFGIPRFAGGSSTYEGGDAPGIYIPPILTGGGVREFNWGGVVHDGPYAYA
jgi:hypothetical protein